MFIFVAVIAHVSKSFLRMRTWDGSARYEGDDGGDCPLRLFLFGLLKVRESFGFVSYVALRR